MVSVTAQQSNVTQLSNAIKLLRLFSLITNVHLKTNPIKQKTEDPTGSSVYKVNQIIQLQIVLIENLILIYLRLCAVNNLNTITRADYPFCL